MVDLFSTGRFGVYPSSGSLFRYLNHGMFSCIFWLFPGESDYSSIEKNCPRTQSWPDCNSLLSNWWRTATCWGSAGLLLHCQTTPIALGRRLHHLGSWSPSRWRLPFKNIPFNKSLFIDDFPNTSILYQCINPILNRKTIYIPWWMNYIPSLNQGKSSMRRSWSPDESSIYVYILYSNLPAWNQGKGYAVNQSGRSMAPRIPHSLVTRIKAKRSNLVTPKKN